MKTGLHPIVLVSLMLPAFAQDSQPKEAAAPSAAKTPELQPGEKLDGGATVIDLDGKQHELRDLFGKITVVNFHSTRAASQRAADARLQALERAHAKHGVVFLHVNSNADEVGLRVQKSSGDPDAPKPYPRLRDYLRKHRLGFRMFVDHHNRVADRLGALASPHAFVFAEDGKLVYRGSVERNEQTFVADVLAQLVAGKKVEAFERLPFGSPLSRPTAPATSQHHTTIADDIPRAHKTALREGKLILYAFSGFNCGSSRIMEHEFTKAPVRAVMQRHFVEARLHTDSQKTLTRQQLAANRKAQTRLAGNMVTPFYVVVDPADGEIVGTFALRGGFRDWQAKWLEFVGKVVKKAARSAR